MFYLETEVPQGKKFKFNCELVKDQYKVTQINNEEFEVDKEWLA